MITPHRLTATVTASAVLISASVLLVGCSLTGGGAATPGGAPSAASAGATPGATAAADPSGGSAGAVGDACTLITEQDVTETLGSDPGAGTPFAHGGATQCQYGSYQTQWVLVNVTPSQGKLAFDKFRNDPHTADAGAIVDVHGVGDEAFEVGSHGSAGIFFLKGDTLVVVSVVVATAASPPTSEALALAKTAASRI